MGPVSAGCVGRHAGYGRRGPDVRRWPPEVLTMYGPYGIVGLVIAVVLIIILLRLLGVV